MTWYCFLLLLGPDCPAPHCDNSGAGPSGSNRDQATLKSFQRLFM